MKRILAVLVAVTFVLGCVGIVMAGDLKQATPVKRKIVKQIKPAQIDTQDFKKYRGKVKSYLDALVPVGTSFQVGSMICQAKFIIIGQPTSEGDVPVAPLGTVYVRLGLDKNLSKKLCKNLSYAKENNYFATIVVKEQVISGKRELDVFNVIVSEPGGEGVPVVPGDEGEGVPIGPIQPAGPGAEPAGTSVVPAQPVVP